MKTKILKQPNNIINKLDKIDKMFKNKPAVKVGFPKKSLPYPNGVSTVLVAIQHEFGNNKGIPERSFLRSTVNTNKVKYKKLFFNVSKTALNKNDVDQALKKIGVTVVNDVKQTITDIKEPPLKVRLGNPLIDTGHLRQSVTYETILKR